MKSLTRDGVGNPIERTMSRHTTCQIQVSRVQLQHSSIMDSTNPPH